MAEQRELPYAVAQSWSEAVELLSKERQQISSEASQVTIWLVGLSSTFLALVAANITQVTELLAPEHKSVLFCLLLQGVQL
jgi:hypothetical protein